MVRTKFLPMIFVIPIISLTEANFDFKLGYCRFKCVDPCKGDKEADNPLGDAEKPTGFYWRDFHGKIPTDAFPLGNTNQYPQTYAGLVFEPAKNGTFTVTIVDGLDYVYVAKDGEVFKKDRFIQILCTSEPERMVWFDLTKENVKTFDWDSLTTVKGGTETKLDEKTNSLQQFIHYLTKTEKCNVNYAGSKNGFDDEMEYALMDGTPTKSNHTLWLCYKKKVKESDKVGKNKAKSFFSHHYEYSIRRDSIIPSFHKQINIGDCSITCTNEDSGKRAELKNDFNSFSTMAYYWKNAEEFKGEGAWKIGQGYLGRGYLAGQNWFEIGTSTSGSSVYIHAGKQINAVSIDAYIFYTNHPEQFEWVYAKSGNFSKLDLSRMIIGGQMDNGTLSVIGKGGENPGSIRLLDTGAVAFASWYDYMEFQVLMFKNPNAGDSK